MHLNKVRKYNTGEKTVSIRERLWQARQPQVVTERAQEWCFEEQNKQAIHAESQPWEWGGQALLSLRSCWDLEAPMAQRHPIVTYLRQQAAHSWGHC